MLARLKSLPIFVLAGTLAAPLWAQDAPAPDPAPASPDATAPDAPATPDATAPAASEEPAAPPADGAPADIGLSLGEPADGAPAGPPQAGEPYIREQFGDWALRCVKAEEGPDPCQLYQLLQDEAGNNIAEISMFPLPPGGEAAAGATIVTPLMTLLTESLTLSVDGAGSRRYPFTFCNAGGCVSRVGFTPDEIAQFKNGDSAQISVVPAQAPDQRVNLTVSLTGFTAGFDATTVAPPQ